MNEELLGIAQDFEPVVATGWGELTVVEVYELGEQLISADMPEQYNLIVDGDAQCLVLTSSNAL